MFATLEQTDVTEVHLYRDPDSALHAIIALHAPHGCSPAFPAIGGCRCLPYDDEQSALADATALARGMSYKAALANLPFAGGKAVILEPPSPYNRAALYHAFGRAVASLGGRYITAVDAGTSRQDLDQVGRATRHVWGYSGDGLDPSPYTALGVFAALHASTRHALGSHGLRGLHIAVQGLGHVGAPLAVLLKRAGASLTLSDLNPLRTRQLADQLDAHWVPADSIQDVRCDAFVPCALGGVLNQQSLTRLHTRVIAGAANNQLASAEIARALQQRGILYAPDYVANAGGLIALALGRQGANAATIRSQVLAIAQTLEEIFQRAQTLTISPAIMADRLAEERLRHRPQQAA